MGDSRDDVQRSEDGRPRRNDRPLYENNDFDDVIAGHEFCATLQIFTPLSVLEHNGEVFAGPVERAPEYGDEAQGCWVPKTKTWEDLGIDIPEPPDTEEASDIGPVKAAEYLPFLKRFRTIVEDMRSDIPNKRAQLIALKDEDDHSPTIWERLCVSYPDFPNSYFYHEFTLIPAIGMKTAKALFDSGIRTIGELSACSQEALSKVPGVGSRAARAVAAHFHNESESATS